MSEPTEKEIFGAAKLYEGEGSIQRSTFPRTDSKTGRTYITQNVTMAMSMVDPEPLYWLQGVLGGKVHGPHAPRKPAHSPYYTWFISNWKEVIWAATLMKPHLSQRRQRQIEEVLQHAPQNPQGPRQPKGLVCPPNPIPSQLGYQRHRKLGIPPCDICLKSAALYQSTQFRKTQPEDRIKATLHCPPEPIASEYPYVAHMRLGIPACEVCLESRRLYRQQLKERHG